MKLPEFRSLPADQQGRVGYILLWLLGVPIPVLFLTALAQKFKVHSVRIGILVLCAVLLTIALVSILRYPRA